jgi:hypothetical protein
MREMPPALHSSSKPWRPRPDADLNGDLMHTKSTGGCWIEAQGLDGRCFPLAYGSRRQGGTSLHTPESEMVSLATFLCNEALPLQHLWQCLLGRPVDLIVYEDNEACITIAKKGYSPLLRCLPRTQRCSLGVVHETLFEPPPPGWGKASIGYVKSLFTQRRLDDELSCQGWV